MNTACIEFRTRLERSLAGRLEGGELRVLGWHRHLPGCSDCRALLESEEALELLLASLPEPRLPPELTRRILARLRDARSARGERSADPLDVLLELDRETAAPAGLARAILGRLETERARSPGSTADARLDALLDLALRDVEVPAGLASRVLASVGRPPARVVGARAHRSWLALAAGVLVLIGAASALWRAGLVDRDKGELAGSAGSRNDPRPSAEVSDALLASLDVLEGWEALEATGALSSASLAELEPADLLVLELLAETEFEYGLVPDAHGDDRESEGR